MGAPPFLREVYREHIDHFGEPTDSIVFDDRVPCAGYPERIDVLIWDADDDCDMTTFATIGMSSIPLPNAIYRAELHFAVRRHLDANGKQELGRFLANLAMYPFQTGEPLDWWHTLRDPGSIPLYQAASSALLHPRFVDEGWDTSMIGDQEVRILNVVPITPTERNLRQINLIQDTLAGIDIFEPR
ncbi:suppressor of fused domain protein [Haloferula sp. BvORR071]|uniref:suppressor of fused domain protein n=1 Tax=Haloferula sp. BvORR071 TaxID=1396141 RepID=UPI00055710C4|nr:suppressor of fused domain protein [Haloferula sp. BvORR071]